MKVISYQLRYLYIALALIPIAVGALGFFTLLKSPYLGINFESKDGKWYAASVTPGSPASKFPEIVGKEVVAVGDFRLGTYDLVGENTVTSRVTILLGISGRRRGILMGM